MDEKLKAKLLGLTSAQGKVLASFHNALPDILGSIGDKPSVPISTLKPWISGGRRMVPRKTMISLGIT